MSTENAADDSGETQSDFIRKFCAAAMDAPGKKELQLRILDNTLQQQADGIPELVQTIHDVLSDILSRRKEPEEKLEQLLGCLTRREFNPIPAMPIGINTCWTDFSASDIIRLPGYIRLHEAAREKDIAVNLTGFTREERGQPALIFDTTKKYKEGESNYGYPDLPELEEKSSPEETPQQARQPRRKPPSGHYKT